MFSWSPNFRRFLPKNLLFNSESFRLQVSNPIFVGCILIFMVESIAFLFWWNIHIFLGKTRIFPAFHMGWSENKLPLNPGQSLLLGHLRHTNHFHTNHFQTHIWIYPDIILLAIYPINGPPIPPSTYPFNWWFWIRIVVDVYSSNNIIYIYIYGTNSTSPISA